MNEMLTKFLKVYKRLSERKYKYLAGLVPIVEIQKRMKLTKEEMIELLRFIRIKKIFETILEQGDYKENNYQIFNGDKEYYYIKVKEVKDEGKNFWIFCRSNG